MSCGMLPVALSLTGGDSRFRQPLAIVVIGGVMMSTLLSLVVIPVLFTFVDDLNESLKRLVHRTGIDTADSEPQAPNDRAA
ncbi:efflux RND transporter permease subunit, partial [Rhizobium johnstonii]|uniref:efflux RND transporter permease subunit n=1 Tax=Rhizobium johnstonii TaxID=3019933 RepID=UPI003F95BA30